MAESVCRYFNLHSPLPEDDAVHYERFGRDDAVTVTFASTATARAHVLAFMSGGVLMDVYEPRKDNDDSILYRRVFAPYHNILLLEEEVKDAYD